MKIYVEYDAAALTALGVGADLVADGAILRHGDPSDVLATTIRSNPLADGWLAEREAPGRAILTWSGTLSDDRFEAHPMTWLRPGREAFARFCDEVAPQLERIDKTLCFQPHSRHVLSDAPSCVTFDRERDGPFGFALSPAEMLEPVMMDDVEDHLRRMFESLGARCAMVILHDVVVGDERCEAVGLGEGVLPRGHILALLRENVPEETPVVLMAGRIERQMEWLDR